MFMRGPLLDALFGAQISLATGPFEVGYVMSSTRLVGAARIRQVRVATSSCRVSQLRALVASMGAACYPSLDDGGRRVAPIYGEVRERSMPLLPTTRRRLVCAASTRA